MKFKRMLVAGMVGLFSLLQLQAVEWTLQHTDFGGVAVSPDGKWKLASGPYNWYFEDGDGSMDDVYCLYWDRETSKGAGELEFPDRLRDGDGNAYRVWVGSRWDYSMSGCGETTSITIPVGVVGVSSRLFDCLDKLTTVKICAKEVPEDLFDECAGINRVIYGEGVETVGSRTVELDLGQKLGKLEISSTVKEITGFVVDGAVGSIALDGRNPNFKMKDGALYNNDFTELMKVEAGYSKTEFAVPESVKRIRAGAFWGCNKIKTVRLGANVEKIGWFAFAECAVKTISLDSSNQHYKTVDGVLYTKDGKIAVAYPQGRAGTEYAVLPGTETVFFGAFNSSSLKKVVLPASVKKIECSAFSWCNALQSLQVLGEGELQCGDAFIDFTGLTELDWRYRRIRADDWAFGDAKKLRKLHIGGLEFLKGYEANWEGERDDTDFGELFDGCDMLTDVYCWGNITVDGETIREPQDEWGTPRFAKSFTLHMPKSGDTLPAGTFMDRGWGQTWKVTVVKDLDPLPPLEDEKPEDPKAWTIESYGNLHETEWEWVGGVVVSPDGKWRMRGCHPCPEGEDEWHLVWESGSSGSADRLEFPAEVEWTDDDPESETYGRKYVWDVCIGYHGWWGGFGEENGFAAKEVVIPREVKRVAGGAFAGSTTITKFSISARVVPEAVIGEDNPGLKEITIGEGAEVVEADAFFLWPVGKAVVDTVRISGTVREIGDSAFSIPVRRFEVDKSNAKFGVGEDGALYGLDGNGAKIRLIKAPADYARKEFAVPGTVREVDGAAFLGCANITAVRIGAGVETIGAGAFVASGVVDIRMDSANRNYKVADGVLFTADGSVLVAYPGKRAGKAYAVPEGTTEIGAAAFYLAENLETLTLPASMRRIGNDAFGEACKLAEVKVLGEGGLRVGDYSFGGMPKLKALDMRWRDVTAESCAFEDSDSLKVLHAGSMTLNRNGNGEYAREIFDGCTALTDVYCYGDFAYGANAMHEGGDAAFAQSFTLHVLKGSTLPARITDTNSDGSKTWTVTVVKDLDPLPLPEDDDKPVVVEGVTLKVVGEGTVSGGGKLPKGKKTTLTAKPGSGWVFAGWYDADGEPLEGSVDWRTLKFPYVVVEENLLIEARFATAAEDGELAIEMEEESEAGEDGSWEDGFRVESLSLPKISVKGLPKGLKWDAKLNKVTGRASVPGEYRVTVSASNATVKKAVSKTATLTVPNLCSGLYAGLDTETTYEFGVGVGTGEAFPALEVPAGGKVSMKGLPSGMKWDARTGTIAGAPTKPGDYTVTITTKVGKETYVDTVSMTVAPMGEGVAGTYNGFVRDGMSYRGTFTMKATANGKVAVKIATAKGTYSFSAKNWDWFEEGIYGATMRSAKGDVLDIAVKAGTAMLADGEHGVWGGVVPAGGEELEVIGDPDMLAKEGGQWKYPEAGALVERFGGRTIGYRMTDCGDGECEWEAVENPKGADLTVKIDAKGKTSVSGKVNGIKVSAKGDVTRDISVVVKDGREKKTLNLYFGYAEGEDWLLTELAGE